MYPHNRNNYANKKYNQTANSQEERNYCHSKNSPAVTFGHLPAFFNSFHGFHVFSGVVINVVMWIKTRLGHFDERGHYEMIEKAGLYWHFVDLVWVFVFLCFYLI